MEKLPFQPGTDVGPVLDVDEGLPGAVTGWREALPVLDGHCVTLRQLRTDDAPSLLSMLTTEEVARFMSPPPTDIAGFERFVAWARREQTAGRMACFGIVPAGYEEAVGLFQVRQTEPGFVTAEWGVALGSAFWGTGVYEEAALLVAGFVFETLKVHRLEARAAVLNGRANGALRKIGAVQEGVLRRSFLRNGEYLDQILWSILAEDWYRMHPSRSARVH